MDNPTCLIKGPQTLVSSDKSNFVLCSKVNRLPYIFAPFEVINNVPSPSLTLDITRAKRAKDLLKALPSVFTLYSNGRELQIDAVHKLISFTRPNFKGLIQYHLINSNSIEFQIDVIFEFTGMLYPPQYIVVSQDDDTTYIPSTFKIFPVMFYEGAMVCVIDSIEKVLHTSIMDSTTGLIGIAEPHERERVSTIQSIWPELIIETYVKDSKIHVFSKVLANKLPVKQGFIKLHRNFGGTDITLKLNHIIPENQ